MKDTLFNRVPLPRSLKIEITTRCNLACRFCGRGIAVEQLARQKGIDLSKRPSLIPRLANSFGRDLPFNKFVEIIEDLPTLTEIDLQGVGEPLLHPEFLLFIQYLSDRDIFITFTTNGTLLTPRLSKRIVEAGHVKQITISIDSADTETHEFIRRGGTLKKVLDNIRYLIDLRNRYGLSLPKVRVAVVLNRYNIDGLEKIVDAASETGVDAISISMVKNVEGRLDSWLLSHDEAKSYVHAMFLRAKAKGIVIEDEAGVTSTHPNAKRPTREVCAWPWLSAMITVDGFVTPCGYVTQPWVFNLGRVTDNVGFTDIWNGEKYAKFRKDMLMGRTKGLPCYDCRDFVRTDREKILHHIIKGSLFDEH